MPWEVMKFDPLAGISPPIEARIRGNRVDLEMKLMSATPADGQPSYPETIRKAGQLVREQAHAEAVRPVDQAVRQAAVVAVGERQAAALKKLSGIADEVLLGLASAGHARRQAGTLDIEGRLGVEFGGKPPANDDEVIDTLTPIGGM